MGSSLGGLRARLSSGFKPGVLRARLSCGFKPDTQTFDALYFLCFVLGVIINSCMLNLL